MVRYVVAGFALAYLGTLLYRAGSRAGGSRVFAIFGFVGLASAAEAVRFALGYGVAARVGLSLTVDLLFLGATIFPVAAIIMAAFGQVELARAAKTGAQALGGRGRRLLFLSALVAQPGLPGYTPRLLGIVAIVGLLSYEVFVAWRYLYAPKRSVPLMIIGATGLAGLVTALVLVLGTNRVDALSVTLTVASVLLCLMALLNFFSVFSTVAISGMALGVGVLTVVLSITSGFQQAFRDKVLGVNAHVIVMKYGLDFSEYEDVMTRLARIDGVVGLGPFYFNEMMVSKGVNRAGVLIKGVDPDRVGQVLDLPKQLGEGSRAALAALKEPAAPGKPPGALLGSVLAKKLKVKVGDTIFLVVPFSGIEALQSGKTPPSREFRVAGIFYAGFDEYDKRLMYVNLRDAQKVAGQESTVTGIELKLKDVYAAEAVARRIERELGGSPYRTIDWRELNHNLFTALLLQKLVLSLFVSLIVLVASFLIVATLTMMSLSKTREIAILRSMGAQKRGIFGLFASMGMIMGGLGTTLGLCLGALLASIVTRYGYKLDPKVYLINELPVQMSVWEFATTAAVTLAIAFLATLYPSSRASSMHPLEGLRND
ncbi:MAG: ABC transporter permease [Deltaproteobacteria bacterium]|nr:ABC transporter permease [Deltaproteobacteria bacterium]